jgi:hypothetical protein
MANLISVVGGYIKTLPFMLKHYRDCGVRSFFIHLHLSSPDDRTGTMAKKVLRANQIEPSSFWVGSWSAVQQDMYAASSCTRPDEWFVYADQDELHDYPMPLEQLIDYCEQNGYEYVCGAFLDRLASNGKLTKLNRHIPLSDQYPLGAWLSYPLCGAYPIKVVLAKGRIRLNRGQHNALNGRGCPISEILVKVNHYKWTAGLVPLLEARATNFKQLQLVHWAESARIVSYLRDHAGEIQLDDPLFLVAPAESPSLYPHWEFIRNYLVEGAAGRITSPHRNLDL